MWSRIRERSSCCTDEQIGEALIEARGILLGAAIYLTDVCGVKISRLELEARVEGNPRFTGILRVIEEAQYRLCLIKLAELKKKRRDQQKQSRRADADDVDADTDTSADVDVDPARVSSFRASPRHAREHGVLLQRPSLRGAHAARHCLPANPGTRPPALSAARRRVNRPQNQGRQGAHRRRSAGSMAALQGAAPQGTDMTCDHCGANLALVGRVHRCVRRAATAAPDWACGLAESFPVRSVHGAPRALAHSSARVSAPRAQPAITREMPRFS